MKAYNSTWIENIQIREVAEEWHQNNMLNKEQFDKINEVFDVGFKQYNIYIRIGLFLFTSLACICTYSFIAFLFAFPDNKYFMAALALASGIFFTIYLEINIKRQKYYNSGVDNALIFSSICAILTAVYLVTSDFNLATWQYSLIALPFLIIAFFRYGNTQLALAMVGCFLATLFFYITQFGLGKQLIPFIMMALSVGIYWLNQRFETSYYAEAQEFIKIMALITFYLSGNYLVVREGNAILNNLSPSIQIDFAPVFYVFSTIIPIFYLYLGIKQKDRAFLIIGGLAVLFSIFTYRTYFSTIPIEWALCLGGLAAIIISIVAIRFFSADKWGISSLPAQRSKYQEIESIILGQILQSKSNAPDTKFGGGNFGGGGAGNSY